LLNPCGARRLKMMVSRSSPKTAAGQALGHGWPRLKEINNKSDFSQSGIAHNQSAIIVAAMP